MSILVLELRQGETMILNGAAIRFQNKTRIELMARARFLFGKQIMPVHEATTPARRIYLALQCAYVGSDGERQAGLEGARNLVAQFKESGEMPEAVETLDRAIDAAVADDCYAALKLVRRVIRLEDVASGRIAGPAGGGDAPSPSRVVGGAER